MSLKEEIEKIKEEEELEEEEEVIERLRDEELRGLDEKVNGLYRRIAVIVGYIDKTNEVTATTEQQLKEDEKHFREVANKQAWELKNLELSQTNKDLAKQLKEQEDEKETTSYVEGYAKGFEDGAKAVLEKRGDDIDPAKVQAKKLKIEKRRALGLGRNVGDV